MFSGGKEFRLYFDFSAELDRVVEISREKLIFSVFRSSQHFQQDRAVILLEKIAGHDC